MDKAITPEEAEALKQQIMEAVESVFTEEVMNQTKAQVLEAVAKAIKGIESPKELGGMGMDDKMGLDNLPEEEGVEEE